MKGAEPEIVGKVVIKPIASVKPNTWNMNAPTEFELQTIEQGLRDDGWLACNALLIWGKDSKGKVRNLIIDGEQRWTVAQKIGFTEAPMVFLDGLTSKQAKALTVKFLYHRSRGEPDKVKLTEVLQSLDISDIGAASIELGIRAVDLDRLLKDPVPEPPRGASETAIDVKTKHTCPECGHSWVDEKPSKKRLNGAN